MTLADHGCLAESSLYERRQAAGDCVLCGKPGVDGGQYCRRHARAEAQRQAKSQSRLVAARRKAGLCGKCGAKSKAGFRCLTCKVKLKAARTLSLTKSLTRAATRLDRIRTQTAVGDDGRTRYHGQERRGRQSIAALNTQDFEAAHREVMKGLDGLALVYAPANDELPRIQRREAEHAALSTGFLAARLLLDALRRSGYEYDVAGLAFDAKPDDEE